MIGLIAAEITKTFKRRTFWVLTTVLALLTAFLAGIFFFLPRVVDDGFPTIAKPEIYIFGAAQVLGQTWFPLILSAMALAGELATSAWATALTRNSRRGQHLVARLITSTISAWLAMIFAIALFSVAAYFFATGSGAPTVEEWLGVAWKALLVQFTWVGLGLAFSAWLRSVGPAIGAAIAFSFIEGLLLLWSGWRPVSLSLATSAILGELDAGGFAPIFGELPAFRTALFTALAWAVGAALLAWAGLRFRDA
ncbi:hypothetical protein BH18ACT6_BH18ACT6_07220 [soil metagenome]